MCCWGSSVKCQSFHISEGNNGLVMVLRLLRLALIIDVVYQLFCESQTQLESFPQATSIVDVESSIGLVLWIITLPVQTLILQNISTRIFLGGTCIDTQVSRCGRERKENHKRLCKSLFHCCSYLHLLSFSCLFIAFFLSSVASRILNG